MPYNDICELHNDICKKKEGFELYNAKVYSKTIQKHVNKPVKQKEIQNKHSRHDETAQTSS